MYVPWYKFQFLSIEILRFIDCQALAPKYILALELTILKLEGSSFGIRPSIYVIQKFNDEPGIKSMPNRASRVLNCYS